MPYKDKNKRVEYSREYGKIWYQAHKEEVMKRRKNGSPISGNGTKITKEYSVVRIAEKNIPPVFNFTTKTRRRSISTLRRLLVEPAALKR